jgi:hypothetical protein
MIAACHLKNAARIGKFSSFDVFDPGAIHPDWHLVLGLTRDGAGVASDTLAVVDDETVFHQENSGLKVMRLKPVLPELITPLAV